MLGCEVGGWGKGGDGKEKGERGGKERDWVSLEKDGASKGRSSLDAGRCSRGLPACDAQSAALDRTAFRVGKAVKSELTVTAWTGRGGRLFGGPFGARLGRLGSTARTASRDPLAVVLTLDWGSIDRHEGESQDTAARVFWDGTVDRGPRFTGERASAPNQPSLTSGSTSRRH